jgi:hypothetical protein
MVAKYLEAKLFVVGLTGLTVVGLQMEKRNALKWILFAANIKNMTCRRENMYTLSMVVLIVNK